MNDGEEDDNACNGPLSTRDSSALYAADEGVTPLASQQIWNAVHINRHVSSTSTYSAAYPIYSLYIQHLTQPGRRGRCLSSFVNDTVPEEYNRLISFIESQDDDEGQGLGRII